MKPARQDALCELALVGVALLHVLLCPFPKVEETFNLHAIYDIQEKGLEDAAIDTYDHKTFTGPLPRSFIGALTVAYASHPFRKAFQLLGLETPLLRIIIIRAVLAVSNSLCLIFLGRRLRDTFNTRACRQFLLLTACQFHIPFWLSRTVPNMLAFGPSQIALACILLPKQRTTRRWSRPDVLLGLAILTGLTVILRLELAALLVPLAFQAWLYDRLNLLEGAFTILFSGVAALSLTVSVDSHFWGGLVWPELSNFVFNIVEGKSHEWGTSPWYDYALVFLPRIMLLAYPFFVIGLVVQPLARRIAFPLLLYIAVMSCLKHKEWRFISYVIPTLNVMAIAGISRIRRTRRKLARHTFTVVCSLSFAATIAFTLISMYNYPGGTATLRLNELLESRSSNGLHPSLPLVHLDMFALMRGSPNLLHDHSLAVYEKNETLRPEDYYVYDYLVTHDIQNHSQAFETVQSFYGWDGFRLQMHPWIAVLATGQIQSIARRPHETLLNWMCRISPIQLRIVQQVWIMKRR